ncbi:MAG: ABC transporter ATP-binding protein [Paracoccus sp. (in: a-proteobacteria)]|uniref:ABC transporter ATP-binding protein n=1 Tax=Paracoccus sp. TaxID=267 RepID=UPI00391BAE01
MPQLTARGLGKSFDGNPVLNDIRLDLPAGAFLALLGPSGCGKTTLLRLIAGLETVDTGELRFDDRVIAAPGRFVPPEQRGLGMVFQSYALWPNMTVRGNVEFALKARAMPRPAREARIREVLETVGLSHLTARRPHELSGGQRQRVALARSLALQPGILLLDEPLANLDAHLRQQMLAEFRRLHARTGATFILVTHDQDEAMAVASHIAVMEAGTIQQTGTPEDLYRRPATPMVARFIGHGATLPVRVSAQRDGLCDLDLDGVALRVAGQAAPGAGWLCLHREDLHVVTGPGHFRAEVLAQSFRNGHYLTHILPRGIGVENLSLTLTAPLPPQSVIGVRITGGWVIPRDSRDAPAHQPRRDHAHA